MAIYYFSYTFLLFFGDIKKKLLAIVFFIFILAISEVFSANIMNILFGLKPENINTYIYTIAVLISNFIIFILLNIISKIINFNYSNNFSKYIWAILILPISTLLLLINISDYFGTFRNNIIIGFVLIGLLISNFISIYLIFKIIKIVELENELKSMNTKNELLQLLYDNNFNFLHNMISKLMLFNNLLSNKEYNVLELELAQLNSELLKEFNIINSNSTIISSLLNQYLLDIQQNNIFFKNVIEYNDFSFLDYQVQKNLFSLIIKIAINECSIFPKNRLIILKTKRKNQQVIIQCIFSAISYGRNNDIKELYKLVEKNNGMINISSDDSSCHLMIIFSIHI